jgi:hypothetical protein
MDGERAKTFIPKRASNSLVSDGNLFGGKTEASFADLCVSASLRALFFLF